MRNRPFLLFVKGPPFLETQKQKHTLQRYLGTASPSPTRPARPRLAQPYPQPSPAPSMEVEICSSRVDVHLSLPDLRDINRGFSALGRGFLQRKSRSRRSLAAKIHLGIPKIHLGSRSLFLCKNTVCKTGPETEQNTVCKRPPTVFTI